MEYRSKTLNAISSAIYTQLDERYKVADDVAQTTQPISSFATPALASARSAAAIASVSALSPSFP